MLVIFIGIKLHKALKSDQLMLLIISTDPLLWICSLIIFHGIDYSKCFFNINNIFDTDWYYIKQF